jgi:hypothetical protein
MYFSNIFRNNCCQCVLIMSEKADILVDEQLGDKKKGK